MPLPGIPISGRHAQRTRRLQPAIVEVRHHLRVFAAGRKMPLDVVRDAVALAVLDAAVDGEGLASVGRHPVRRAHLEFVIKDVQRVAGHVAQVAGAEIPPGTPVAVMVNLMVRARRRWAAPLVPVHPRGRRLDLLRSGQPAGAVSAGPEVHFAYRPDGPAQQQLRGGPGRGGARILKARLGGDLGGQRRGLDPPRLGDGARHRLGAVDVLVHGQARQHQVRVPVVRRGDDERVEVLLLFVEHLAEVLVDPGPGIELEHRRGELGGPGRKARRSLRSVQPAT